MGPDLFGILWAMGFLAVVLGAFAAIDRLVTGAWDALRGSPGMGLVAGMAAWRDDTTSSGARRPPSSPGGAPPESPQGAVSDAPEAVATERVQGPSLLPWGRSRVTRFAA